eukprot:6181348-Pleurochrysis_carterae.AAC.3
MKTLKLCSTHEHTRVQPCTSTEKRHQAPHACADGTTVCRSYVLIQQKTRENSRNLTQPRSSYVVSERSKRVHVRSVARSRRRA